MKSCPCQIPRPRTQPGKEDSCVVCGFSIPAMWSSARVADIWPRLLSGMAGGATPEALRVRDMCLAREQNGRQHFGYRFHGRDSFRDGLEEAADWLNYRGFEYILALKDEDQEKADNKLIVMMKILEAVCADLMAGTDDD